MIFISSPYSHDNPSVVKERYINTVSYAAYLLKSKKIAISPVVYGHSIVELEQLPGDWTFWDKFCFELLTKCEEMHVLMLPGWDTSSGIKEEESICRDHNIPIQYIPYPFIDFFK